MHDERWDYLARAIAEARSETIESAQAKILAVMEGEIAAAKRMRENRAIADADLLAGALCRFLDPITHESEHAFVRLMGTDLTIDGHGLLTEDEAAAVKRVLDARVDQ